MAPLKPHVVFLLIAFFFARSCLAEQVTAGPGPDDFRLPETTSPSSLNATGSLRSDYFSSSKNLDEKKSFYGLTAQLKILPSVTESIDGKLEARFIDPDITHHDRTPSKGTLLEGYINIHAKQADLCLGKQNAPWGRADAINPTDNLTPHDYTILLPFEEDQRFGTIALKVDYYVTAGYVVTLFTTPLFEPSLIPLPLPQGATIVKNNIPARTFSNTETGVKLNKSGGDIDWSVSYYHGFSLLPEIRLNGSSDGSGLPLELRYPEIDVAGADAARNYGRYGFRVEAAYISPKDYDSKEITLIQSYFFTVFGVDRTFFENINVNLQAIGRFVPHPNDPEAFSDPTQRLLAEKNAVLFGQQHGSNWGLTSRISDLWLNNTLEAELLMVVYFNPTNEYVRPLVSYAFSDNVKGSVGADIYSGPEGSFYGIFKSNQGVFAELRYAF
jgi:hypothetical protein